MITLSEGLAMADWQILLGACVVLLIVSSVFYYYHIKAPEDRKNLTPIQPFSFTLLMTIPLMVLVLMAFLFL